MKELGWHHSTPEKGTGPLIGPVRRKFCSKSELGGSSGQVEPRWVLTWQAGIRCSDSTGGCPLETGNTSPTWRARKVASIPLFHKVAESKEPVHANQRVVVAAASWLSHHSVRAADSCLGCVPPPELRLHSILHPSSYSTLHNYKPFNLGSGPCTRKPESPAHIAAPPQHGAAA